MQRPVRQPTETGSINGRYVRECEGQATRATVDAPISYGAAIAVELDIEAIDRRCEGLRGSLGVHGKISSERCGCREKRAANHARKHGRRIQGASSGHDHPNPNSFVSPMARHCH